MDQHIETQFDTKLHSSAKWKLFFLYIVYEQVTLANFGLLDSNL